MIYVTIPLGPAVSGFPYGLGSLGNLIGNTVGFGIIIGAVFALLWLLLGGITWITSSGDKAKLEEARDRITQSLIGLALVMATWAIWTLVTSRFFGLNLSGGPPAGGGGTGAPGGTNPACGRHYSAPSSRCQSYPDWDQGAHDFCVAQGCPTGGCTSKTEIFCNL